ncbi:reverse transcriptase domain-containing protein [Sphingobacterium siyangense]|uniref:RNA-directed DNA polymerase n=1 Tax=Sphingobacterium siyangense TaxID=459529 RepID=UPI003DA4546D
MATVSENLRSCGIKINTVVAGVQVCGSGILYLTSNLEQYNYVLTAKHIFQEDTNTPFDNSILGHIEILYSDKKLFKRLEYIKKKDVVKNLVVFEQDFVIIKVNKNPEVSFSQILVSDHLRDVDQEFFAWGIFAANEDQLQKFDFGRSDGLIKRFKLFGSNEHRWLKGMSGAGLFSQSRSTLLGVITEYPNREFQNATIDLADITFAEINVKLKSLGLVELDTDSSHHKREINKDVVDIHQAIINDTTLNLEIARKRLSSDITDDWFHDPLKYIDLLNQDYLFVQFEEYFNNNKQYVAKAAEAFYVPKKKFTLRLALVSPFMDRIMYMACVGVLAPKLDQAQIANVYSAKYNYFDDRSLILNGVEQWRKLQYQLNEVANLQNTDGSYTYNCIIEIDLLNFYDNISKEMLHKKILRICETENEINAAEMLSMIINRFTDKAVGLPQNSDASALLASFYLNQVDIFMQHHAPQYYRFMDDIRIFCKDKYEARKILQTFEFELRRCYLSVNSQKTEIFTIVDTVKQNLSLKPGEKRREDFTGAFDLDTAKISRYRRSKNFQYRNEAFHAAVEMLRNNLDTNSNQQDEASKKMNFALNTIAMLAAGGLEESAFSSKTIEPIVDACADLIDRPWLTNELCRVMSLMPTIIVEEYMLEHLMPLVLDERYTTYAYQIYQIWMLLAKHKIDLSELKTHAVKHIEKNDDTNKAVIAGMVIYLCSVDLEYRRVILRKYFENFTHGYFQNRLALVALRSFRSEIVRGDTDETLKSSHKFSHKHKDRDLVFVSGFDEFDTENRSETEQLYSL